MAPPPKFTKKQLVAALRLTNGDQSRAAAVLGVGPSTVHRAMKRFSLGLEVERRVISDGE